jgi:hypothetical protein
MELLTASMISAILSYLVACKMKHKNEEIIDEKDFWAPQPLSRQRYGN